MSQPSRVSGSALLVAAILAIPSMVCSIAYAVQKADAKCTSSQLTVEEKRLCELN